MAAESQELTSARDHLRKVESAFHSSEAEFHLEEGFTLLEMIGTDGRPAERRVAKSIGSTYLERLVKRILELLAPHDVPEPDLKHLMRMSQILSRSDFAADSATDLKSLTGDIATRYIDAIFEGYSEAEKDREIRRLMKRLENS